MCGPSPRAWGILPSITNLTWQFRSIPTGVGNTEAFRKLKARNAVHPHGRGEYMTSKPTKASNCLVVKEMVIMDFVFCCFRFTLKQPLHGRGCTERAIHGPSPRAWGIPFHGMMRDGASWSIPTGVGNTCSNRKRSVGSSVHPHGRGEYALSVSNSQ